MTTQLRLVEPPEPATTRRPRKRAPEPRVARARVQPARTRSTSGDRRVVANASGRRVVAWGEWQLDARTRTVGRAGVARARRALEEAAAADPLSQAS